MDMDTNNAPGWLPNDGDTIVGRVVNLSRIRSTFGAQEYYPIVTIKLDEGYDATAKVDGNATTIHGGALVAIHGFHYVLKRELASLRPREGERLGVAFKGMTETKDGKRTVAVYVVKVEGRQADVWAGMGEPEPVAPASDIPVSQADFQPVNTPAPADDDDIPF